MAKITDMGNSRIVRPGQVARTLSALPGTLVYMPPEAQDDAHRYGPPLDIFSFGHLALFTFIQVSLDEIVIVVSYYFDFRPSQESCSPVPFLILTTFEKFVVGLN